MAIADHAWALRTVGHRSLETAGARLGPACAAEAASHRGEILEFSGRVTSVTCEHPPDPKAEQFDLPEYYRCEFAIGKQVRPQPSIRSKCRKPGGWTCRSTNEPPCTGFFLKLAGDSPELVRPVSWPRHVAWHPATLLGAGDRIWGCSTTSAIGPLTQPPRRRTNIL